MQSAAGGTALLEEGGAGAGVHVGTRAEHPLQHGGEACLVQRPRGVEVAAGGAPRQEAVEVGIRRARQGLPRRPRPGPGLRHVRRRRAEARLQPLHRQQPGALAFPRPVHALPSAVAMRDRRGCPPAQLAQPRIRIRCGRIGGCLFQQQPFRDQARQGGGQCLGQSSGIQPFRGAGQAKQLALGGVDFHRRVQVPGQREPAQRPPQPVAARQQVVQREARLLPRFQHQDRASTNPHIPLPLVPGTSATAALCSAQPHARAADLGRETNARTPA